MKIFAWRSRVPWLKPKKKNTITKIEIELDGDGDADDICLFCSQAYKYHPLNLPYYNVRTLCSGKHIRP